MSLNSRHSDLIGSGRYGLLFVRCIYSRRVSGKARVGGQFASRLAQLKGGLWQFLPLHIAIRCI